MPAPKPIAQVLDRITGAGQLRTEVAALQQQVGQERDTVELLQESIADLQTALLEPGWVQALASAEVEFAPASLVQLRAICRLYNIKNPLIKRGLALRSAYVWGQDVEITARANGKGHDGEQDVQAVVSAFLNDPGNQTAFTGPEARDQLERSGLGCEGEVFVACVTRPRTGEVSVRTISPDQITDVIRNPDDQSEPWYYKREWVESSINYETGSATSTTRRRYYPALGYRPRNRPQRIGTAMVAWDSPILHVAANRPRGWTRGIPDAYAAIDWAKAYKEFLEDWAKLMRALSRYAWKAKTPGKGAAQVRAKVATAPTTSTVTGKPLEAGATAILSPDVALEAINKTGATFDAESGRPLAMMVASALGVPVTMLLADPGQTGARATAETLDRPTELEMGQRRKLWAAAYHRLITYVITESVRAVDGKLKGVITADTLTGRETLALAGDTDPTVDITWPDLDDTDPQTLVEAIVKAAGTGTVPPELVLRLLLTALGVRNIDTLVERLLDEEGHFLWPQGPPLGMGGDAARRQRSGDDPARAGPGGSMLPDEDELDDEPDEEPVEPDDQPV